MRLFSMSILVILLFFNCSSDVDVQTVEMEPLTDVLTLELSFGDEKTIDKNDYLLVRPMDIIVTDNGDIIVADESRLKVYDSSGNPKIIIGRPGQGPGEFERNIIPLITETGYITVINSGVVIETEVGYHINNDGDSYNLFAPDYTLVERRNLRNSEMRAKILEENNWSYVGLNRIYTYTPDERLIYTNVDISSENKESIPYRAIIHQIGEKNTILAMYEDKTQFTVGAANPRTSLSGDLPEFGQLFYSLLTGHKIVYTNTNEHKSYENDSWYYSMYVYDLKTREQREIKKEYIPVAIPDSVINLNVKFTNFPDYMIESAKEYYKVRSEKLNKLKTYPPLQRLYTDNNFIFAVTSRYVKNKGNIVDVFDSEECEYIKSVYFPFFPNAIKNGYAYYILHSGSRDEFPLIEKYRIDPAVYWK